MSLQGRKNAYYCDNCGQYIVTIDKDEGVTPAMLACRVLGDPGSDENTCRGIMQSLWYPEEPWPELDEAGQPVPTEPTWEWYRPDEKEIAAMVANANLIPMHRDAIKLDHVQRGGLLIRQIT